MKPTLITLEGERDNTEIVELLGMDYSDSKYIKKNLSPEEILYLNAKYPEYMGAIPAIIAKIASVGVKIGQAIAGAVKKKKAKESDGKARIQAVIDAKIAAYKMQQQLLYQEQQKKKQQMNLLLMAGIPLALVLIMLARR